MEPMRLNKFLAQAGVASRRKADQAITDGLVVVNGKVVTELGLKVDPERDHVKYDGKRVEIPKRAFVYLAMNKPKNVMVTRSDPEGRPTVFEYMKRVPKNLFNIGRLDFETEGLLLFTDDGDLAYRLTHPKFAVPRTYHAKVKGVPDAKTIDKMRRGMVIDGVRVNPSEVRVARRADENSWLEITLTEGRNRQVRKMCAYSGFPVAKLRRVSFATIALGKLPIGAFRRLTDREVKDLKAFIRHLEDKRPTHPTRH